MGELAPEFKQKIANFDGHANVNDDEKAVIFYVESYARDMPPAYLNKLINAIEEKLKNKKMSKDQIRMECENAIDELNAKITKEKAKMLEEKRNRSFAEKGLAVVSDITTKIDIFTSDEAKIQIFRNGRNDNITVKDFEDELKTKKITEINSFGLANYFTYLHNTKQLTPEVLIQKFWGDALLELGTFWKRWWTDLIAYTALKKNGLGYIIDIVTKLGSTNNTFDQIKKLDKPKELDTVILLLQEKENLLKTKFKNELKTQLITKGKKEPEVTKITEKLLEDLLKCKGKYWVVQASKIIAQYDRDNEIRTDAKKTIDGSLKIASVSNQRVLAENKRKQLKNTNSEKQQELKKEQKIIESAEQEREEASLINKAITAKQRQSLVSWEKTIDQVITQLQKEDKEFNKEYTKWQKEKEQVVLNDKINSKENTEPKTAQSSHSDIFREMGNLDNGKSHTISLNRNSENADKLTIKRNGDSFIIQLGSNAQNTMELPKEKVSAYVQSLRFMEKLGLGYFIRNLPQNELSSVLELASKDTIRVNNKDGDFDETEKQRIISCFGKVLGIEGTNNINSQDGQKLFQWFFFTHSSIETILASKNIIQNGILNNQAIREAIKSA